jgi:four helix bundle protein
LISDLRFEDLEIWSEARDLCNHVFKLTIEEPFCSDFRFRDQIRASSGSVMDNIAEGFERGSNKEFIQFLFIAKGSCGEVRSLIYRAYDNGYISEDIFNGMLNMTINLSKHVSGFITNLKSSDFKGPKYHKNIHRS